MDDEPTDVIDLAGSPEDLDRIPTTYVETLIYVRARTFSAGPTEWEKVFPEDVPASVKDPDVIARMRLSNELAQAPEDGHWYGCLAEKDFVTH